MSDTPPYVALGDVTTVISTVTDDTRFACALGVTTWGAIKAALQGPIDDKVATAIAAKMTEINAAATAAGASAAAAALSQTAAASNASAAATTKTQTETLKGETQTLRDEVEEMHGEVQSNTEAVTALAEDAAESATVAEDSRVRAVDALAGFADSYAFRGFWSTNTAPVPTAAGNWWIISVACTFASINWAVNDRAVWTGSAWGKLSADDAYKTERDARLQGDGNKLTHNALELTGGYLTIPKSAEVLSAFPTTYCLTYTKRGAWANNDMLISNTKVYTRAGYTPKAGFYLAVQNADNRTIVAIQLNSPNVDGDSVSLHTFDLLPLGTHTLCLVIEGKFTDGTTTSTNLPQKIALYLDGQQLTPKIKSGYLAAEFRRAMTAGGTTLGPCNYYGDAPPSDVVFGAFSEALSYYRANVFLSRIVVFNAALPALAASSPYLYSVEQYALGEAIPKKLLSGHTSMAKMAGVNVSNARYTLTHTGQAATLNIIDLASTLTDRVVFASYDLSAYNIQPGALVYWRMTTTATSAIQSVYVTIYTPNFSGTVVSGLVAYRNGVQIPTYSGQAMNRMAAGTYEFYFSLNPTVQDKPTFLRVQAFDESGANAATSGTTTTEAFVVYGAVACLDQVFRGGNQLPDRGINRLSGVVEEQTPPLRDLLTYRGTLNWLGTFDAKALLSSTTNIIPANTRVVLYAKASMGTPTVAVANGSTTLTASATLASTTWTEVGSYFYNTAAKLTVQPSEAYTGDIYIMARLEPLTL